MKKLIVFVFALTILCSCAKTEKDFIGDYKTLKCEKLMLNNDIIRALTAHYSGEIENENKVFYELSPLTIKIFNSASTNTISGLAESISFYTSLAKIHKEKLDFDLVNIRIDKDTLRFQLTNEITESKGIKINGFLFKEKEKTILGIDKYLTRSNRFTTQNPLFYSQNKSFICYSVLSVDESTTPCYKAFYESQIVDFKLAMDTLTNENDKITIGNSIEYLKTKIDGLGKN